MATNSTCNSVTKTVSMDPEMAAASEARAKALGFRAYSTYVQNVLQRDLNERPDIVLTEKRPDAKPISSARKKELVKTAGTVFARYAGNSVRRGRNAAAKGSAQAAPLKTAAPPAKAGQ